MKPSTLAPFFIAACLIFAGGPVMAHDDATLDTMTAPNGGQLESAYFQLAKKNRGISSEVGVHSRSLLIA